MKPRFNCVLGLISIILLSILNMVLTIPLFIIMLFDQIKYGAGTMLEMGTLIIWMFEIMCLFPFTLSIFFFVVSLFKRDYWHKIIINIIQITLFVVLNVLSNIWMFL